MRLTFVIDSLGSGGAERVMTILANHFVERGDDVALVTLDDGSTLPFFDLDPRVRQQALGTAREAGSIAARLGNAWRRLWTLRRRIRANSPDVVLSFMDRVNYLTLAATIGMRTPVVVSERNDPAHHNAGPASRIARKVLYRRAAAIAVQTGAAAAYFTGRLGEKTVVIPNPVLAPAGAESSARAGNALVAMGRLTHAKGFDLLLRAFASVAGRFPEWNLTIWGEGELRGALEGQRNELGLADRVRLPGRTAASSEVMRRADVFVLSSRHEGLPNVLLEAMACGAAAISFDCPSGPADIIESGMNGVLVAPQNVGALAAAMASLMGDEPERRRLGVNAERVAETFSPQRVMAMWASILESALKHSLEAEHSCAESPGF